MRGDVSKGGGGEGRGQGREKGKGGREVAREKETREKNIIKDFPTILSEMEYITPPHTHTHAGIFSSLHCNIFTSNAEKFLQPFGR